MLGISDGTIVLVGVLPGTGVELENNWVGIAQDKIESIKVTAIPPKEIFRIFFIAALPN